MTSNWMTYLILGLYLFLPPVLCIGANNHLEVEAKHSHSHQSPAHEHGAADLRLPHSHHHHTACIDVAVPAEAGAKVMVLDQGTEIASLEEPAEEKPLVVVSTHPEVLLYSLQHSLRVTVLIV